MQAGEDPDPAGQDQHPQHEEQGADDRVLETAAFPGRRMGEHAPAEVWNRPTDDPDQQPEHRPHDQQQGDVGAQSET
jgi:hypothetical protein